MFTYCDCVFVALGIHHVMRMSHIVMWSVRLSSHYPINCPNLENKIHSTQNAFWFSFQCLNETFLILRRFQGRFIINEHGYSPKLPIIAVSV
jgi:hypothetical protein